MMRSYVWYKYHYGSPKFVQLAIQFTSENISISVHMTASLVAVLSVFLLVRDCAAIFEGYPADDQVVMIISLDAFKPGYLDLGLTKNMKLFRRLGSYSPYMIPRFPTKTFVNHFSLATG